MLCIDLPALRLTLVELLLRRQLHADRDRLLPFRNHNGADGLAYGGNGILWVAANQADQVIALDEGGRVRAKLGDFLGFDDGKVDGLLFPASLIIVGDDIFVTNLAFPLGSAPDEPEADTDLTTYTISRIPIPAGL